MSNAEDCCQRSGVQMPIPPPKGYNAWDTLPSPRTPRTTRSSITSPDEISLSPADDDRSLVRTYKTINPLIYMNALLVCIMLTLFQLCLSESCCRRGGVSVSCLCALGLSTETIFQFVPLKGRLVRIMFCAMLTVSVYFYFFIPISTDQV